MVEFRAEALGFTKVLRVRAAGLQVLEFEVDLG